MSSLKARLWVPSFALTSRELVRFWRQKSRLLGALGTPLIFWFILGSGMGSAFRISTGHSGMNYLEYFFPGTVAMILLFTSIFSSISLILDRQSGFLQGVYVAPVSRSAIVLGTCGGGAVLSVFQGMVFLLVALWEGYTLTPMNFCLVTLAMVVFSFALTAFSFFFASRIDSVQGFHAIMNIVLFPLWLISGALFPISEAPTWLQYLMKVNPISYGVALIRQALYFGQEQTLAGIPSFGICLGVVGIFGIASLGASLWTLNRHFPTQKR